MVYSPDERRLRLASGVSEVQDQRQVAVVDSDAGDIDDARDALLYGVNGSPVWMYSAY